MEQQAPTICLLVEHALSKVAHALYKIELPLDLSHYDQMIDSDGFMIDSKNISPVITFKEGDVLSACASVTLGSKIYYFGGVHYKVKDTRRQLRVQFFDTQHPELGMQTASPLTVPKFLPCVFVADGMIYALGAYIASIRDEKTPLPGCKGTGYFERYDPTLDQWQVLSDPPLPNAVWANAFFSVRVTMVGRRVFIGCPYLYVVFNLDDQDWEQLPPQKLACRFFCASFFVQDSASLYHLHDREPVQVIKNGPLALTSTEELLKSPCLDVGKGQVVAEGTDLEDMFFSHSDFCPDRIFQHMGDRFFCYVVSAQLADMVDRRHFEPNSRGVWIKFFEAHDGNGEAKFRTLASFCYKIDTNFFNQAIFISCSVLGTVPDSWIKAPLEKKLVIKLKPESRRKTPGEAEQRHHEAENAENREEARDDKKLITLEEENRRLVTELGKLKELLKMHDESRSMVHVRGGF